MADDVGYGVSLTCSGRPLDGDAGCPLEILHDGHLLIVVGQWKVELFLALAAIGGAAARKAAKSHGLIFDRLIGRRRYQRQRARRNVTTTLQLLLQALQVLEEIVV